MIQFSSVQIYMNMGKCKSLGELVKSVMFQIFLKEAQRGRVFMGLQRLPAFDPHYAAAMWVLSRAQL